jgi:hypothetical protein
VIHEEGQEPPENIPDYENETEDNDREKETHDELADDVAVDQFHRCRLLVPFHEHGKRYRGSRMAVRGNKIRTISNF